MWITRRWLEDYVDLHHISDEQLADRLTNGGIPVEVIEPLDKGIEGVIVGHVIDVQPHPNADKLRVCTVDVGSAELLQIVCGAPNVVVGQRVPTAIVGAKLPEVTIKKAKLRGVESQGMLCSAREIGLNTRLLRRDQTEGLYVLPDDAQIGADIRDVLHLRDAALELELTPNRSDCLSLRGVAYEVAALFEREMKWDAPLSKPLAVSSQAPIAVELDSENCERYGAQIVRNVKIGPSPLWLQSRLMAVGVRPINNIVDVTNYVMFEYGQPLHAFDLQKLHGDRIIVRQARDEERFTTLDGVERMLDSSMLVIADVDRPVALAGVMGGENSEVDDQTTDVVLESAWFNPVTTRATVKKLGLRSEASLRFEKGIDPDALEPALARAAQLLADVAGGSVGETNIVGTVKSLQSATVSLSLNRVRDVLGLDLSSEEICGTLNRLGFGVSPDDGHAQVTVPTRRPDIVIEEDLIEEVGRLVGYDEIPTTMPNGAVTQGALTPETRLMRIVRGILTDRGMDEVVTYSFVNPDALDNYRLSEVDEFSTGHIELAHPMSDDRRALRKIMLPSLIEVAQYNINRRMQDIRLFEFGRVYAADQLPLTELPAERLVIAGLLTGSEDVPYGTVAQPVDFYYAKGIVETVLDGLGILGNVEWRTGQRPWMHPTRTAELWVADQVIGYVGQVHPAISKSAQISEAYSFELDTRALLCHTDFTIVAMSLPRYPAVERDIAIIVPKQIEAETVQKVILRQGGVLLERVSLFDVYMGSSIAEDRKSLAYRLVFRAPDRTLTDDEVTSVQDGIVDALRHEFDGALRA